MQDVEEEEEEEEDFSPSSPARRRRPRGRREDKQVTALLDVVWHFGGATYSCGRTGQEEGMFFSSLK